MTKPKITFSKSYQEGGSEKTGHSSWTDVLSDGRRVGRIESVRNYFPECKKWMISSYVLRWDGEDGEARRLSVPGGKGNAAPVLSRIKMIASRAAKQKPHPRLSDKK